jgi:hypothetical protein
LKRNSAGSETTSQRCRCTKAWSKSAQQFAAQISLFPLAGDGIGCTFLRPEPGQGMAHKAGELMPRVLHDVCHTLALHQPRRRQIGDCSAPAASVSQLMPPDHHVLDGPWQIRSMAAAPAGQQTQGCITAARADEHYVTHRRHRVTAAPLASPVTTAGAVKGWGMSPPPGVLPAQARVVVCLRVVVPLCPSHHASLK